VHPRKISGHYLAMTQAWEVESYLEVRDNQLHIDGVSAVKLAEKHGTPVFILVKNGFVTISPV